MRTSAFAAIAFERLRVEAIADEDRKLRGADLVGDPFELLFVAPGEREPKSALAADVVADEVVGHESPGESRWLPRGRCRIHGSGRGCAGCWSSSALRAVSVPQRHPVKSMIAHRPRGRGASVSYPRLVAQARVRSVGEASSKRAALKLWLRDRLTEGERPKEEWRELWEATWDHLLATPLHDLIDPNTAKAVADRLFDPELITGLTRPIVAGVAPVVVAELRADDQSVDRFLPAEAQETAFTRL